jgi:putative protease
MTRKIELLAPGGDLEAVKAAIVAGANAVYCGLDAFNARNRASNLSMEELFTAIRLAHEYHCEIFLTLNIVILEYEIPALVKLLNQLVNSGLDGIIVQDLGVFDIVNKHFPNLKIHASTQMTTHNEGQILFLNKIGATRVNLSRELNLPEIKLLSELAHQHDMLTEVFVHGALCIAFSGQCYSSSVSVGNSGNRGRCSQACRDEYEVTATGNKYPLNLKDNSAYFFLPQLVDAKVDSLKIEGRIKDAHYVYTVVESWRAQINSFIKSGKLVNDDSNLHKVFNRSFTNSFLTGNLSQDMFIESPRDYSVKHAINSANANTESEITTVRKNLYDEKAVLGAALADKLKDLNLEKSELTISYSAKLGYPLIIHAKTNDKNFEIKSSSLLVQSSEISITEDEIQKTFKNINNARYSVLPMDFSNFDKNLFVPFKEIKAMKNQLAYLLNDSIEMIAYTEVPKLLKIPKLNSSTKLSILISDELDAHLGELTEADIYFKLPETYPESSKGGCTKYIEILTRNPRFIPWFPAVQIGKHYNEAVKILEQLRPKKIVTNNTGIAYKAYEMGIEWVAGPFMNTTNSHALVLLKEEFNCAGAFISNEINHNQMRNITRPKDFKLMYSIYHPILLMTSRQCFFQQTVGCNKPAIDDSCMQTCQKATTIRNVKGISFSVDKQKGGYPSIYNNEQFLNLEAIKDLSDLFDEFFIDLTDIGSGSKEKLDKVILIQEFEKLLAKDESDEAVVTLKKMVINSTNAQYEQGL